MGKKTDLRKMCILMAALKRKQLMAQVGFYLLIARNPNLKNNIRAF